VGTSAGQYRTRSGTADQSPLRLHRQAQQQVLVDGHIVKSGGKELALELEAKGYDWILKGAAAAV